MRLLIKASPIYLHIYVNEIWINVTNTNQQLLHVNFQNGLVNLIRVRHSNRLKWGKPLCTIGTLNPEIFARILFSRIALKDIFATLKIRD